MIVATVNGKHYKVDGLANRGEWFGETWLVQSNIGVFAYMIVVEAEHEQAVIDALTDSNFGHMIRDPEPCEYCEKEDWDNCYCILAGNAGERVNLDYTHIMGRCKVAYFERPDSWDVAFTTWGKSITRLQED